MYTLLSAIQGVHKIRVHFKETGSVKVHTDFMDILYLDL